MTAREVTDRDGHSIFAVGDIGAAHVLAHELFDNGRMADGHRFLGRWLEGRRGQGSDWVHIEFHMALFELALGQWDAAHARFIEHILPAAATSEDALTDAPALAWRLQLAAPRPVALPWLPLRRTALARLRQPSAPFVELHNLLALAGAGDLDGIDRWLATHALCDEPVPDCILRRAAVALRAYASRAYKRGAEALAMLVPQLRSLGGSKAQHELFEQLACFGESLLDQQLAARGLESARHVSPART